jgi:hypothetical protein
VTTPHFGITPLSSLYKESFRKDPKKPLPSYSLFRFRKVSSYLVNAWIPVPLSGTEASRIGTFCPPDSKSSKERPTDDTPTWMDLLNDVHDVQHSLGYISGYSSVHNSHRTPGGALITITRRTRSWDFMPPDIVRPVASTTIGCLISMTHHLGMTWLAFNVDEGKLRSAGNGRSFSTSLVRGMGFVIEYSRIGFRKEEPDEIFRIPSVAADKICGYRVLSRAILTYDDKLACGIIQGSSLGWMNIHISKLPDLPLRTANARFRDQLGPAFTDLWLTVATRDVLRASLSHPEVAQRLPGFADILGLWSDWLPIPGLSINRVDNPFPFPIRTMGETPEARVAWMWLLKQQESTLSDPKKKVLKFYKNWLKSEPIRFRVYYRVGGFSDRRDSEIMPLL